MHFRTLVVQINIFNFSLTFFASQGYVGGLLIFIGDWLKRDLLFSLAVQFIIFSLRVSHY